MYTSWPLFSTHETNQPVVQWYNITLFLNSFAEHAYCTLLVPTDITQQSLSKCRMCFTQATKYTPPYPNVPLNSHSVINPSSLHPLLIPCLQQGPFTLFTVQRCHNVISIKVLLLQQTFSAFNWIRLLSTLSIVPDCCVSTFAQLIQDNWRLRHECQLFSHAYSIQKISEEVSQSVWDFDRLSTTLHTFV